MVIAAVLGLAGAMAPVAAQAVPDLPFTKGVLSFDAHATLGAFTGTTRTMTGHLAGAADLAGARGWVEAPAASLSTDNGKRDRDMASSMEFDKFAIIRFDLESVTRGQSRGDSIEVTLHGQFTIHGQTRKVDVPGWVWLGPKSARFRGAVPMNVKAYGVGGLSKMLGVLKMDEMITVRMDVTFGS